MKSSNFRYDLPEELIAYEPCERRSASRLLCLDAASGGAITHRNFIDLPDILRSGDLLVFNNSKVVPAKLEARRHSGGYANILVERILTPRTALAYVKAGNSPPIGAGIKLSNGLDVYVRERRENFFILELEDEQADWSTVLDQIGQMPLPPYIKRQSSHEDRARYQTVYAEKDGSVAAPTAGLHFDDEILAALREKGINTAFVTLHVGSGTFMPLRSENALEHKMHAERIEITQSTCDIVNKTRQNGGRVIAVGTTSLRSLESAWQGDRLEPFNDESNIFITPGCTIKSADALITNFHLPETTLMMLVCAFAGYRNAMSAYQAAIAEKYRFFSYGDAMFIAKNPTPDKPEE